MLLSVIVPARNESDVVRQCLESLLAQSSEEFQLGRDWELLLVNDGSTDGTREIAAALSGPIILDAGNPLAGWTGKANAVWTGANRSQGEWLLFTDADTIHCSGSLQRALHEAERKKVVLLSYSPRQIVTGFWQRALMPLIFAELVLAYPPEKVSDPNSRVAAANGQFLLIERQTYFQVGGHSAVADSLLEDVDLAFLIKRRKLPIYFRYAPDALEARMYRSFGAMYDGWTKNLSRLFGNCMMMAAWKMLDVLLLIGLPLLMWAFYSTLVALLAFGALWIRTIWRVYARTAKSNFPARDCALSGFGLPLFCLLLARSWFQQRIKGQVRWKGREIPTRGR